MLLYDINEWKCELDETKTSIVKISPFRTSMFNSKFLITLHLHTRDNSHPSLMYTMYVNASNKIPSCTHINLYVVWSPPPGHYASIDYSDGLHIASRLMMAKWCHTHNCHVERGGGGEGDPIVYLRVNWHNQHPS